MKRLYQVNYDELVQVKGSKDPETGATNQSLSILADCAEQAVAKLRKKLINASRTLEGSENDTYRGVVKELRINEVKAGGFVDIV